MKRTVAFCAALVLLCPPSFASDWVEDGEEQANEIIMQAPVPVESPPQELQASEVSDDTVNMDLCEFTPGYAAAFGNRSVATATPSTARVMSLPMAFADTEQAAGLQPLSEDVALEFRMDRLERQRGITPTNGRLRNRLNTVRKMLGLPVIPEGRLSWPDEFINAIGRGVMGGVKTGGKAIAKGTGAIVSGTGAIVSGTGEFLSTPGVPELLLAGAILGVGIPLLVQASKNSGGGSGYTNPNVVWVPTHVRSNGTLVHGHYRTAANDTVWDNFGTKGNYNPYTGQWGTINYPRWAP